MLSRGDEKNKIEKIEKIKIKKITIQKRINKDGTGTGMECAQLDREQEREANRKARQCKSSRRKEKNIHI